MDTATLKALFDSGELTIDTDKEPGYYGETTVTITVKHKGVVIATETTVTYSDNYGCNCGNY